MKVCRVVGTVVSSAKDERLNGFKLLVVAPASLSGEPQGEPFVALDTVGAGFEEVVLVALGSSARETTRTRDVPTDATVVAIVDSIESERKTTFRKS